MKKYIFFTILFALILFSGRSFAQDTIPHNRFNIGLGMGIDYGGFGGRIVYIPIPHVAVFGAGGYNLVGFGFNIGATYKILPDKKVNPTLSAMYGYNGVIKVDGADYYNKIYYGPSLSVGMEINSRKKPGNYFNLELVIPFRSQSFKDDWDVIENDPKVEITASPLPVGFSIGYHFRL